MLASDDGRGEPEDLPQIVIGLAVTCEGIPVRCWVWPGNTADVAVLTEVKDDLRGWRLGRVVTVVDRGFSSKANLDYCAGSVGTGSPVNGCATATPTPRPRCPAKAGTGRCGAQPAGQGSYAQQRGERRVRVRWIVCHRPVEAERDAARRQDALERLTAELQRIATARTRGAERRTAGKKAPADDVHVRAECALRDHPTLGRWLRQLPSGRLTQAGLPQRVGTSAARVDCLCW